MDDNWGITKLAEHNWSSWKFQMEHMLKAKKLFKHLDGTARAPAEAADTEKFEGDAQNALSYLVRGVGDPLIYLINSCTSAKQVWDTLRAHFERNNLANKLYLKKSYFRAIMKEGTAMKDHIKFMKELTDQLGNLGVKIEEEDQVVTLLGSLPESYKAIVTALEARADTHISLEFVQQALINEEQKNSEIVTCASNALMSEESSKRRRLRCPHCKKRGHKGEDCWYKEKTHEAKTALEDDFMF